MPSGTVHAGATRVITGLFVSNAVITQNPEWVWVAFGSAIGLLVGPDLDVDGSFHGDSLIRRVPILGKPLELVYKAIWWPYRKVMPHRSKASHFPVISTLFRYVYIIAIAWGISRIIGWDLTSFILTHIDQLKLIIFGNFWADFAHWGMDAGTPQGVD